MDWSQWSRDAVALMKSRNEQWQQRFGLWDGPYRWDLEQAEIEFAQERRRVVADICLVGTASVSAGSFLWGWANDTLPPISVAALAGVRQFGRDNDLGLLTTPEIRGGRAEGLECAAIAGRIQDASGVFVDSQQDVTWFFTLRNFVERDTGEAQRP